MSLSLDAIQPEEIHALAEEFEGAPLERILEWAWTRFGTKAAIGTSFQGAGLVLIDTARMNGWNFPVFTLDTGLLFPETLELKRKIEERYHFEIESLHPEQTVAEQAIEQGPELWNRHPNLCCTMRKVIPLQKKLNELDVWITGLRRQQSDIREGTKILELYNFDPLRDLFILKMNPMANWTRDAVQAFLREHDIPTNALASRGYRSIGCQPCTRPTSEGANERAGRWTGFDKSECGIHTFLGKSV